jgi:membrane protease YdiL (CAAX protease family)
MSALPDHDPNDAEHAPLAAYDKITRGAEESSADTFAHIGSSEISSEDSRLPDDVVSYDEGDAAVSAEPFHPDHIGGEPIVPAPPMALDPPRMDGELHLAQTLRLAPYQEEPQVPHVIRIPNFGDLLILLILIVFGWLCAGILTWTALHFNLFGVSTIQKAITDIHYTLGSMIVVYLGAFLGALIIYPMLWGKGFFAGIQWNGEAALRLRWRLFGAAFVCFLFALLNGALMPGPDNAPIDKIFRAPGAAWLLFAFGITAAPFFEEMFFRGFLLPALCTAFDWASEKIHHEPGPPPDENGHPRWSLAGMAASSVLTSIPFALMHAEQTGYSLGPFVLLVCVSMVLCWARLSARSLAASVLVHASYNSLLFSFMLLGTSGFQHLDKM